MTKSRSHTWVNASEIVVGQIKAKACDCAMEEKDRAENFREGREERRGRR